MADKKHPKKMFAKVDGGDVVVMLKTGDDEDPQYKTMGFDTEAAFKKFISLWREDLDATEKTGLKLWAEKMERRKRARQEA